MSDPSAFSPSSPLGDALVILGAAGVVIPVFARFRITPVIGFILVGLLVGPYGLGRHVFDYPWLSFVTISDADALEPFAEFGIILLLFSVGLELSFGRLWSMRAQVFGLGAMELLGAGLLTSFALAFMGEAPSGALALGLALAMSSTALVLPIAGTHTAVGRSALAMLLFEDLALVPILFLLSALAPHNGGGGLDGMLRTLGMGVGVVIALLVAGRILMRPLFAQAARTKSPELFLAASLIVVIVASLATAGVGLSPIVGALTAGLLIAETEYHTEVEGITAPFKGLALGVFLITVGMSIDLASIARHLPALLGATAALIGAKALVTSLLLRLTGTRAGQAAETGLLMASPSESTLIVLGAATTGGLIQPGTAQFWQIVTALGLTITPLLAMAGRAIARRVDRHAHAAPETDDDASNAAIIVGFGRVGQLVADMLARHDKPYIAIDSNPDLIAEGLRCGYRVAFGNAASPHSWRKLGVGAASAVILTMDEPITAARLVRRLRAQYPDLPILARARDPGHAVQLYKAGATQAIPETLESSLQLSESVLVELGVPMGFVIASIHEMRDEFREQIMQEGGLQEKPRLKSSSLRERS
ncbi:MAG TPA: cation:proton antiporter [Novosphingobium sp.]|nr:cation:proton antiporter [Novosphingobium sp.]